METQAIQIQVGCKLSYVLTQPTPMIVLLNVHFSQFSALVQPDYLTTIPPVPVESYRDGFGNWCCRLVAPTGPFTLGTDGVVRDDGLPDPVDALAVQHPVEDLPAETLVYLMGSRYCDTDWLSNEAWLLFENSKPGWARVQAICDFVHDHVEFGYAFSRPTRTAWETYSEGHGVCRDYTHLAIAFCRCMNIPARYCTGYISEIGRPPNESPPDFCAWMEVYLGGKWHVFDPRNNTPRIGRILIARGRDAADVPLTQLFGQSDLTGFEVWTDPLEPQ